MTEVLIKKENSTIILTLNRERVLNALNLNMVRIISENISTWNDDDSISGVLLRGTGEKAFCAGADLKTYTMDFATRKPNEFRDKFVNGYGLGGITRGLDIDKPLIAAINGYAVSGGLEIALACDLRFCSENAKFGLQDVKWGFHACDGALVRLPHIVGMGATMELVLSGELINAEHAHKINLVNKLYSNNSLLEKTLEYAHLLTKRAPLAIKFAKQTLRNTVSMPLEDALRHEVRSFYDLGQSEDLAEGTRAFRERRDAEFKGR